MTSSDCCRLLGALSAYIDGEAEAALCEEIQQHVAGCERCRVVVDTLRKTVWLYQQEPRDPLPEAVQERLYTVLKLDDFLET